MLKNQNHSVKFVALGGLDERGCNVYCVEVNKQIFVFEVGATLPFSDSLGINIVLPDFLYLKQNKNQIAGIFISKPSSEYVDGLSYLLKIAPKIPVYLSRLSHNIVSKKLYQAKVAKNAQHLIIVEAGQVFKVGGVEMEAFKTTSGIPDSFGFALYTKYGTVVYTGDYVFDQQKINGYTTDIQHWNRIACRDKVLMVISDASTANQIGYTAPFHHINNVPAIKYEDFTNKRVFLVAYQQDINKIQEFLESMLPKTGTQSVIIYNYQLFHTLKFIQKNFRVLKNLKIYDQTADLSDCSCFVIAGNLRTLHHDLLKIALDQNPHLQFKKNDHIILINPPIPGEELNYAQLLDEISRCESKTTVLNNANILTTSPSSEDIKMMLSIFCPQYYIPVKGLHMNLIKARQVAVSTGMSANQIIILDNGQMVGVNKYKRMLFQKLKLKKNFLEKESDIDKQNIILRERDHMSKNGALVAGVNINKKTKRIISSIDIQIRGIVSVDDNQDFLKSVTKLLITIINNHAEQFEQSHTYDVKAVIKEAKSKIQILTKTQLKRYPITLIFISEI